MRLVEPIHDTLAGARDARIDRAVAEVEEDKKDPGEKIDAHLD